MDILKAEDLNLIGDDTTLIRMIKFFTEYKKKFDEWKRKEDRKEKNRAIAMMVSAEQEKNEKELSEPNIVTKKLKPFYVSHLKEEDVDQESKGRARTELSSKESSFSSRIKKELNVIRDRSVEGKDKRHESDIPENVLLVDGASVGGQPSVAGSKYYLTEGSNSVSGKRKVTLNIKIPKSRLANLKNIRALIRTRDAQTNELVSKEKTFNLEKIEELASGENRKKKYHFKSAMDSGKDSVIEKSTDLPSQLPSIGPESRLRVPLRIEKMGFAPSLNHLPNLSSSFE